MLGFAERMADVLHRCRHASRDNLLNDRLCKNVATLVFAQIIYFQ
jgi:hypothetical protein